MGATRSQLPDYSEFQNMLQRHSIEAPPSEAQGVIAAVLCLPQADQIDWLALFLSAESTASTEMDSELSGALLQLFQSTRQQLSEDGFEFNLYLPSDGGIAERTASIAAWCRGFLLGISAGQLTAANTGDVVREILADIVEISGAEPDQDGSEEDERALAEIEEYLRAAVHLLKEELSSPT